MMKTKIFNLLNGLFDCQLLRSNLFIVFALLFIICSCDATDNSGSDDTTIPVTGISIDETSIFLGISNTAQGIANIAGTYQLSATIEPSNATNPNFTWVADNEAIVTVNDNGLVQAHTVGVTTIRVISNDGGIEASCNIDVRSVPFHFSQCTSPWSDDIMGTEGYTICATGSLLVSIAMMLTMDDPAVTPATLNDFLNANNGYSGTTLLYAIVDFYPTTSFSYVGGESFSLTALKRELDLGNPVPILVYNSTHWFLCIEYFNDGNNHSDFQCYDPADVTGSIFSLSESLHTPSSISYFHRDP